MTQLFEWYWQGLLWGAAVAGFTTSAFFLVLTFAVIGLVFGKGKKKETE